MISAVLVLVSLGCWEGVRGWRVLLQNSGCVYHWKIHPRFALLLHYWLSVSQSNVFFFLPRAICSPSQDVLEHISSCKSPTADWREHKTKKEACGLSVLAFVSVPHCLSPLERLSERRSAKSSSWQLRGKLPSCGFISQGMNLRQLI